MRRENISDSTTEEIMKIVFREEMVEMKEENNNINIKKEIEATLKGELDKLRKEKKKKRFRDIQEDQEK